MLQRTLHQYRFQGFASTPISFKNQVNSFTPGRRDTRLNRTRVELKQGKAVVVGVVERGGNMIARHVPDSKGRTLMPVLRQNVRECRRYQYDDERRRLSFR